MQRIQVTLWALVLSALLLGCGSSERERGKNSQSDRPKAATPTTGQQ